MLLITSGCTTDAVQVSAPEPTGPDKAACAHFLSVVPRRVDDLTERRVVPDGASARAFGDPAVVVTCGGTMPSSFNPASPCIQADGVGWYADQAALADQSQDVTLATIGWQPVVTVTIPAHYRPEGPAAVMADLAMAVKSTLKQVSHCQ